MMHRLKRWLGRKRGWLRTIVWKLRGRPVYRMPKMVCADHRCPLELAMYSDGGELWPHLYCSKGGHAVDEIEIPWQDDWPDYLYLSEVQAMGFETVL